MDSLTDALAMMEVGDVMFSWNQSTPAPIKIININDDGDECEIYLRSDCDHRLLCGNFTNALVEMDVDDLPLSWDHPDIIEYHGKACVRCIAVFPPHGLIEGTLYVELTDELRWI